MPYGRRGGSSQEVPPGVSSGKQQAGRRQPKPPATGSMHEYFAREGRARQSADRLREDVRLSAAAYCCYRNLALLHLLTGDRPVLLKEG